MTINTDLSFIKVGKQLPPANILKRNRAYNFNMKLFTGDYAKDKYLMIYSGGKWLRTEYKILPLHYFSLLINKLDSLIFNKEVTVTCGDAKKDEEIKNLLDRTDALKQIRKAFRKCEIFGDVVLKVGKNGINVINPNHCLKVVDEHDIEKVKYSVIYELLYETNNETKIPKYVKINIYGDDICFEQVFEYSGSYLYGTLGKPVRYRYKDRWIPRAGRSYKNPLGLSPVQWFDVNNDEKVVYGESAFKTIKDIVFLLEERISTENYVISDNSHPYLAVSSSALRNDETTGKSYLAAIDGNIIKMRDGEQVPQYINFDGKLDNSRNIREDLESYFYEISEMSKAFLSGEYSGQISEESLNQIIKSAIDRGNRELNNIWEEARNAIYLLCKMNGINISLSDLNIIFNIGRADDNMKNAEISEKLINTGLMSRETVLQKFWSYGQDDATEEIKKAHLEGEQHETNRETS